MSGLGVGILRMPHLVRKFGVALEATELAKRALALAEQQFGPDSQETGWIVHSLAMLYLEQGRNDESQHLLKRSMEIDQKTLQRWQQFKTHSQAQRYADKLANDRRRPCRIRCTGRKQRRGL
jgi:predicted Zn-dependent protease